MARTRTYRNGVLVAEDFPVAEVSDYLDDPTTTVWLDMCAPTEDDLAAISEELSLHRLAVEDAVHEHQRPKLDRYDDHMFLSSYVASIDEETAELTVTEVDAFVTPHALVTVRSSDALPVEALVGRWDQNRELTASGVPF